MVSKWSFWAPTHSLSKKSQPMWFATNLGTSWWELHVPRPCSTLCLLSSWTSPCIGSSRAYKYIRILFYGRWRHQCLSHIYGAAWNLGRFLGLNCSCGASPCAIHVAQSHGIHIITPSHATGDPVWVAYDGSTHYDSVNILHCSLHDIAVASSEKPSSVSELFDPSCVAAPVVDVPFWFWLMGDHVC